MELVSKSNILISTMHTISDGRISATVILSVLVLDQNCYKLQSVRGWREVRTITKVSALPLAIAE